MTIKHAEVLAHEPLAKADGSVYMGNLFWSNPIDVQAPFSHPCFKFPHHISCLYKLVSVTGCVPPCKHSNTLGKLFQLLVLFEMTEIRYTTRGGGTAADPEVYTPSFTYHGFRYAEIDITGTAAKASATTGTHPLQQPVEPVLGSLVALNLRSSVAETGVLSFGSDRGSGSNLVQKLSNNSWLVKYT